MYFHIKFSFIDLKPFTLRPRLVTSVLSKKPPSHWLNKYSTN